MPPPRSTFMIHDFSQYQPLVERATAVTIGDGEKKVAISSHSQPLDVRVKFLQSILKHRWKAERLVELHINIYIWRINEELYNVLRTLLMTPGSLPNLIWLDVNLQARGGSAPIYELVDVGFLKAMPAALPSLTKLCLAKCSAKSWKDIAPGDLKTFFASLRTPLASLSITHVNWMTDEHVAAFLPVVGGNLTRLELIYCKKRIAHSSYAAISLALGDASANVIAKECGNLKSLALVETHLTTAALAKVLRSNPNISTLNLSESPHLDASTVSVITRYLPRLRSLRNYWGCQQNSWLTDDALISLIDAQKCHSKGPDVGPDIYLEVLGLFNDKVLTKKGLNHALKNGVKRIEIDLEDF